MNNPNINKMELPDFGNTYPEIFYKIQPYILMICDQMDTYYGDMVPNQEMLDQMSENIFNILVDMYPDIKEYARSYEQNEVEPTVTQVLARSPRHQGRGYRRNRGLLRDLIDILFFSEYYRRRRRYY